MKYANYVKVDTVNGKGCRVTLYPSGCTMNCAGCFNKAAQDFDYGTDYTSATQSMILHDLSEPYIKGLSIIGGHALERENFSTILELCKEVKRILPDKDIYLWTGYTLLQVQSHKHFSEILDYVDVLIDGKFVETKKDPLLYLRGSTNQTINYKGINF